MPVGRPKKEDGESVSFRIYRKTYSYLKDLNYLYYRQDIHRNKPLIEIAHEAIEEYVKKEEQKIKIIK